MPKTNLKIMTGWHYINNKQVRKNLFKVRKITLILLTLNRFLLTGYKQVYSYRIYSLTKHEKCLHISWYKFLTTIFVWKLDHMVRFGQCIGSFCARSWFRRISWRGRLYNNSFNVMDRVIWRRIFHSNFHLDNLF